MSLLVKFMGQNWRHSIEKIRDLVIKVCVSPTDTVQIQLH